MISTIKLSRMSLREAPMFLFVLSISPPQIIQLPGATAIGWTVAVFTGRSRLFSALRQLGIAVVAAGVTYGVGTAVGVHTGL